jgi:hypothetical protein
MTGGHLLQKSNAAVGFRADEGNNIVSATSTSFDSTTGATNIGISINPGASGVWTFTIVSVDMENKV